MHNVHILGSVLHQESGVLLFSYPSNSAELKRDTNCESAELGTGNECAERRDRNISASTNL